ncbi:ABC transporter permease [Rossellomorea vietnamensis]|uniref:ABC transporter permease n=1 Tax=Rossellomorea vietnamensis TaxID=218284 RepID=UPI001CCC7F7E|nr:ABC transporter permease [Rossellomorea vietnamensis]MCA0150313.1 ABC transporter permease [Rossellomorea vietnamensis]
MTLVFQILREQVSNLHLIFRLASFEVKSKYQLHYLGILWQFIQPLIQILIYWFVFGIGIRGGSPVGEVPYFIWLITGLIPWLYINPTVIQGSNSVYSKINLVSKMKFPVSVLPTITIIGNGFNFIILLGVLMVILLLNGIFSGLYLIQLPYYLLCLFVLLFSLTLLFSTLSTIVRDFQVLLQSTMRMMLYLTPILWETGDLPKLLETILKLNPFYYIIQGFRDVFLGHGWFFNDMTYTIYFWFSILLIILVGSKLHTKFKNKFVDYL